MAEGLKSRAFQNRSAMKKGADGQAFRFEPPPNGFME
jgi:hypothetical protein